MSFFFFFNDTATTEIYTLSLHDALPIYVLGADAVPPTAEEVAPLAPHEVQLERSEEHTSELQSQSNLVCRLLLEKKKKSITSHSTSVDLSSRSGPRTGTARNG